MEYWFAAGVLFILRTLQSRIRAGAEPEQDEVWIGDHRDYFIDDGEWVRLGIYRADIDYGTINKPHAKHQVEYKSLQAVDADPVFV